MWILLLGGLVDIGVAIPMFIDARRLGEKGFVVASIVLGASGTLQLFAVGFKYFGL